MAKRRNSRKRISTKDQVTLVKMFLILFTLGIIIKYWYLGLAVVTIYLFWKFKKPTIGEEGEKIVNKILDKYIEHEEAVLLKNVLIGEIGVKTSQIDHILITRNNLIVIETKNYNGMIHGSDSSAYWYQTFNTYGNITKNRFLNPFIQNENHIKMIKKTIPELSNIDMINVVCFVEKDSNNLVDISNVSVTSPNYLITNEHLVYLISNLEGSCSLDIDYIKEMIELKNIKDPGEHSAHIKRIQSTIQK